MGGRRVAAGGRGWGRSGTRRGAGSRVHPAWSFPGPWETLGCRSEEAVPGQGPWPQLAEGPSSSPALPPSLGPRPHPPAGGPRAPGPRWASGTSAGPGRGRGCGRAAPAPGRSAPSPAEAGGGGGGGAGASCPWAGPAPAPVLSKAGPQTGWSCSGLSPSLGRKDKCAE